MDTTVDSDKSLPSSFAETLLSEASVSSPKSEFPFKIAKIPVVLPIHSPKESPTKDFPSLLMDP
ncbi:hypothetical protein FRC02_010156 [Tulasnella sp. 418]|nr:hypothetical protein FRC02_010156 [Tulasnella sp. 418]